MDGTSVSVAVSTDFLHIFFGMPFVQVADVISSYLLLCLLVSKVIIIHL